MAKCLFANNAISSLAGGISNTETSCVLSSGQGALFPNPGAAEFFMMTFINPTTGLPNEIVKVTARAGDVCTIVRGQEGTSAVPQDAGTLAQNLLTAGTAAGFVQTQTVASPVRGSSVYKVGSTLTDTTRQWTADSIVVANLLQTAATILLNVTIGINIGVVGANGYDGNGALGTSVWLYDFVIYNSTTLAVAGLSSKSRTAPTLPSGYDQFAYVGACYVDSSGHLMRVRQVGHQAAYVVTPATNTPSMPQMVHGIVGTYSGTAPVWAAISVATFCPPNAGQIRVTVSNSDASVGVSAGLVAPNSSYAGDKTSNPPQIIVGQAGNQTASLSSDVTLESGDIYAASGGNDFQMFASGWTDIADA